ncbi:LPXTG cell wall anchor domain-containing protein [Streptomyces sp. NPDC008122]|uniref:LPXTG cell wall anchor domain-containing protein n=1 Tax=Streptomyces sp. NPDC008122 TaxID=3364810 RepID=UPI0036E67F60
MAGSSLALAPAAFASDGSHHYALHQPTPILASEASHDGDCPTIPADKDGWHFVIPTNGVNFVKLTVTFEPGGEQVITSFGPPSDKHAYVASAPGAKLVSAEADVDGVIKQGWFNLSHTCVATSTTGGTTGEQTTGGSTTGEQTTGGSTTGEQTTGGSTTGEQTTGGSTTGETTTGGTTTGETTTGGSTTGETTTGETTTGGSTTGETTATGGSTSGETSATGGSTTGGSATGETSATGGSATGGEVKDENGNLAETGSSAPVGIIAAVALALAAAGAVLVTRRRKAQQN